MATYYSAEVAQEQLEQSKEGDEEKERNQAARVTYWEEGSWLWGGKALHLLNRSSDPVSAVAVLIRIRFKDQVDQRYHLVKLDEHVLPPCSEVVHRTGELSVSIPDASGSKMAQVSETRWRVDNVEFTDRAGKRWSRTSTHLKLTSDVGSRVPIVTGVTIPMSPGAVKALDDCGAEASGSG
ncbi:hypothetical protein ACF08O_31390 [Streptomyces paradoxus]|uniref:hypothetical protein n=1 Tax=Streptomyces paradoxus TaxID=66375 RepID=UPI0036FD3BB9